LVDAIELTTNTNRHVLLAAPDILFDVSPGHFHPIVRTWFERRFGTPTDAQAQGWPAIAEGRHTLIAAPTGSGKTLAAFLNAIDGLVRQGLASPDGLPDATQVVYVSPLKALSNDVQKNLEEPLAEITALAEEMGTPIPSIRVAVRTGDTPQRERTMAAKHPPHILITTPESLFILLTSESGRRGLRAVHTVILDELHAVAPNKRGSHLAISVERLCRNSERDITRIGLSATQKPIEEIARFLVGGGASRGNDLMLRQPQHEQTVAPARSVPSSGGRKVQAAKENAIAAPECTIVDVGHRRAMDIAIELPRDHELGPIATHEQWAQVLDQIADLVRTHKATLLFVNTRRLVERVAHQLHERLGEDQVAAHHGSLSRETRLDAEQRLKSGAIAVCVATASLELGIDVGDVDLVCQIGSPRNIGVGLQRVGRSGHFLGGLPKGRFFPLTRDEMVETVALVKAIGEGTLDSLRVPAWPLDILAQQIVATTVGEEWWDERELYDFMRGAYPYRDLPYERYDGVLDLLVEGVAGRWGRNGAYMYRDGVNHRVKARRGGRIATITSGGSIPDTADYLVVTEPEGTFVGSVNEDFAIESMAGDIFLLGNTPWRIRRVEAGVMRVEEAQGQSPTIPFWLGEAPGRTPELSREVSEVRREVDERLPVPETAIAWVMEQGAGRDVAEQVVEYIAEGKRVLGMVPTAGRLIAERFFDEAGGMQLVIHSLWGRRINRAWGMALRKRFCRNFDFELQAAATDEGINLSLGPQHSFLVDDIFRYVKSNTAEDMLIQAVLQSPVFGVRWRWVASRSLALLRQVGGKRVPAPIQRMRSDDLLAAVFPDQIACQDNAPAGADIEIPDHPFVFETMRDCLTEALDSEGMKDLLGKIERGEIEVYGKDTVQPSVFSHQVLNAMPYAFLDDAPLEERRARAVTLRRALPEDARDLGSLDEEAIAAESAGAWPVARDADELHDTLMTLGVIAETDVDAQGATGWHAWLAELKAAGRAMTLAVDGRTYWLAMERSSMVAAAYPNGTLSAEPWLFAKSMEPEDAEREIVRGRVEATGPFTTVEMAEALALAKSTVDIAVARLEGEGLVLRGQFRTAAVVSGAEEWCDRRILARIHRSTVDRLRQEVEPVPASSYIRFLLEWQHLTPGSRLSGEAGLIATIEQLQGFEAAARAWEQSLLPARVHDYSPAMLDAAFFSGEATWGRFARRATGPAVAGLSRNSPVSLGLREDTLWLLDPPVPDDEAPLNGVAAEVLEYLTANGASFLPDIVSGVRRLPAEVEDGLWQLVAGGRVTADGFGALRGLISGVARRAQRSGRRSRFVRQARPRLHQSRWTLLRVAEARTPVTLAFASAPEARRNPEDEAVEARAGQLLRRYGVFVRELLVREPMAPPWRQLLRAFRRAEARGEIRGGRFLAGFAGEQFALPEAVDALRAVHKRVPDGEVVRVAATDPLNVAGILTPGPRVPATAGNELLFRDGVLVDTSVASSAAGA
jgi:ATP-dependent Lhr-like helicase